MNKQDLEFEKLESEMKKIFKEKLNLTKIFQEAYVRHVIHGQSFRLMMENINDDSTKSSNPA